MYYLSLFAKNLYQPYSNEILYDQFVDKALPIKTPQDLNLTHIALSALSHNKEIPECAMQGDLGIKLQFLQEISSKGSKTFKEILLKQIEKKKEEIQNLKPENKKRYLEKQARLLTSDDKKNSSRAINQEHLSQIFKAILPLQGDFSLTDQLQYSLSIESLTTNEMDSLQISSLISAVQHLNLTNDATLHSSSSDKKFNLKTRLSFIEKAKLLTENMTASQKAETIKSFSRLHTQDRVQLFNLIQARPNQNESGILKANRSNFIAYIYSLSEDISYPGKEPFAEMICSFITLGTERSHIALLVSDLTSIPSQERTELVKLVHSIIPLDLADLTGIIELTQILSVNDPQKQYIADIVSTFLTYPPKERTILVELITNLLTQKLTDLPGILSILTHDKKESENYNPTYITDKEHQEDYLQKARRAIHMGTKTLKSALCEDKKPLFFLLLAFFSKQRGLIAKDHKTPFAERFGVRRDFYHNEPEPSALTTVLSGKYQECGEKVLSWLAPQVQTMVKIKSPHELSVLKKTHKIKKEALGCQSILRFELLSQKYIQDLFKNIFWDLDREAHNINRVLEQFEDPLPRSAKALLARASISLQIKKKTLPLTQYYTWVSINSKDPNSLHFSETILLHQDHSLIQKTLDVAAEIFQRIAHWNKGSITQVQEQVALLTYILAHNAKDRRGSAAGTEWMIHTIYNAADLQISEDPNRLQDLEAFARPLLSDYVQENKDMIQLKRK